VGLVWSEVMKPFHFVFFLVFAAFANAQEIVACLEEASPVAVSFKSFIVSEVTTESGIEELFEETDKARPGQVIEYRVVAKHVCGSTLPAGLVGITGPVPNRTTFVNNSATVSSEQIQTQFTCDTCDGFHDPPVILSQDEEKILIKAEDYTAVRWTLLVPLEPGGEVKLKYRVMLNQ
jgi:uncharacterized repeat protein (TIGR01451 family)